MEENNMTQGDWQAPVEQPPKKNKFIIAVAVLVIIAVVAFVVLQNKKEEVAETPAKKVYTAEEKIEILQNLSSARDEAAKSQAGTPGSTLKADGTPKPVEQVTKERTQILQNLSAVAARSTTLSNEEKLKILNSLSR
ncbi:MAG: hypothetical protein AAB497_01345 [Patescibacteria group bacterium]